MSRTTKWIYTALLLILIGAGLIIAVGSMSGWDPARFTNTVHLTAQRFPVEEPFTAIDLRGCGGDVTLLPAENGVCRVVTGVSEDSGIETEVEVRDGVLVVTRRDTRPWYARISFNVWTGEDDVTIFLPEERTETLELRGASSQILVGSGLVFGRVSVETASGDIRFQAEASESLRLKTSSGAILLEYSACGDVALESASGEITVRSLQCGDFASRSNSGSQLLEDLSAAGEISAVSTSGEKLLRRVTADGALTLESKSGETVLEMVDAASVSITSTSGEVRGTVVRRMDFRGSANSGEVRLPESDPQGGAFTVRTSSGDIRITVAN
ncbi:MAG: DUF4097 family beta strand repeat-containing protein [Eubacteriales bacterium]|nr:DUF4097 family beta strand repeat-containing protein [Eubacteriales bacterium]